MKYKNGLFIFRRDYRITDNTTLHIANKECENVYTIFIFTPEQVSPQNKYKSNNAVQFMIESIEYLANNIKQKGGHLYTFYGTNIQVISECINKFHIDSVYFNKDYTPYSITRDNNIIQLCNTKHVDCVSTNDYYLHSPEEIFTKSNTPYQKFTPYYVASLQQRVQPPFNSTSISFSKNESSTLKFKITLEEAFHKFTLRNHNILVHGGRENAIRVLKQALSTQKHYSDTRNDLSTNTTQLSAYIKFGCVSIREVYDAFKNNKPLLQQLIWRDFYASILFHYPKVLGHSLKPKYDNIKWNKNASYLNSWKKGTTGFPIVDACMRQLNTTGYMHNRGRLIVASFLVKTLLINWREGEQIFAKQLVDYDVASNNGNWQWIAGSGADSQPFFRIFNPWSQSKDHDKDAIYIKKWVPELKDVLVKDIHKWHESCMLEKYDHIKYPDPIVNYEIQKQKCLQMYHQIF
jgi:deoxyribodipyrimidine photo-lyase